MAIVGRAVVGAVALFSLSAPDAGAESQPQRSADHQTSFELQKNQIIVQARIEGRGPFTCIVDTAVDPSIIDITLARKLALAVSGQGGAAEGIGTDTVTVYPTRFSVSLGGSPPMPIPAVAMNLSSISKRLGRPLDCVLGQSWLTSRVVEIDYPKQRLRFGARRFAGPPDASACEELALRFWTPDDATPLVEVEVNGVATTVSLDTGSSGTLSLFPDSAAAVGVEPPSAGEAGRQVTGARGTATVADTLARSFRFGPISADEVKISVRDRNLDEPPGRMGNLGNGLLLYARLTLDYPARKLSLCVSNRKPETGNGSG